MSEQEITSPPFATQLCTPLVIHRQLQLLEGWVDSLRYWANEESRRFEAPEDPFIPDTRPVPVDPAILSNIAIPSLFRTWMTLRAIRERWDWIYRNYEENWDCDKCIFSRIMCVKMGALILLNAFLDPETHEAKQEEERKAQQEQLAETLKQIGIPDTLLQAMGVISGDDDKEEIDFDKLFHPDDN
jgi:hypothetical protein|tara:strand:- start:99 stop:656 length:558 start_codon:yes stop_codon:yes gene_type:complete